MKKGLETSVTDLIAAVRAVRQHRQMNAAEPPESQDAWDRLALAVLETERALLRNPMVRTLANAMAKSSPRRHKKLDKHRR
jgi:hypothetical protein